MLSPACEEMEQTFQEKQVKQFLSKMLSEDYKPTEIFWCRGHPKTSKRQFITLPVAHVLQKLYY